MATSAAGTSNVTLELCIVGDGAGAPTSSRAAVNPTLEQATRTIKTMVSTEASFKLSITKVLNYFEYVRIFLLQSRFVCVLVVCK